MIYRCHGAFGCLAVSARSHIDAIEQTQKWSSSAVVTAIEVWDENQKQYKSIFYQKK